jgi:hypothetical protein
MSTIRADKIKPGMILSGMPNRTVTAVERFDNPDRPGPQWVRLSIHQPAASNYYPVKPERDYVIEVPPDWEVDYWPARDDDEDTLDDDRG